MPPAPFTPPHLLPNFESRTPEGDHLERLVCRDCGHIHYSNPKIVTASVVVHEGKILLCRRAIEPRLGFWTMPGGFMEERETSEAAARREAFEEAGAKIEIEGLLAVYNIPRISQVQLIYRAKLSDPNFSPGPESLEAQLFAWDDIPWSELAFPTVLWALRQFKEIEHKTSWPAFGNPQGIDAKRL